MAKDNMSIKNYQKKYHEEHKEELKIYSKKYREEHKEEIVIRNKKYNDKHKEEKKLYDKKYHQSHKKERKIYRKKYQIKRRKTDTRFKIAGNLRNRVYNAIKRNTKSLSTMLLIGCEMDYLLFHLQSQFTKGMNWDNYGKWHIDHIKPCCKFDLSKESEQKKCFNYKNLQPLWAEDNLAKSAK